MAKDTRKVVGKDAYENSVFEGQVPVKDAHGNLVYRDAHVGTGPAHAQGRSGRVDTGKTDAHGNKIHVDAKAAREEAEE